MKNQHLAYGLLLFICIVFGFLSYATPLNPSAPRYGLTDENIAMLRMTIIIPYILVWIVALYGVLHVKTYIDLTKGSLDSKAFSKINSGLTILLASMILSAFVGSIRNYFYFDQTIIGYATIVTNYLYVFSALIAFIFISNGASALLKMTKLKKIDQHKYILPIIPVLLFGLLDVMLIFTNENRQTALAASNASYYLSDFLILTTIVVPSIVTWIIGIISVVKLVEYRRVVAGIFYKEALHKFMVGLFFVILSSAIIQALLSLGATRLVGLGFELLLGVVYLFVAVQSLGYIFIALGAKKLTTIEKV